jgi:hypothetical protein
MIRVSFAMVKQAKTLLPRADMPKVLRAAVADPDSLDVIMAMVPDSASEAFLRQLPESRRWQELNARSAPRSGTVRTTTLSNHRQTLASLGYVRADASVFERLSLAGRMLKEAAARSPGAAGLIALGEPATTRAGFEALLAATLAQAFQLPAFRAPAREEHTPYARARGAVGKAARQGRR